MFGCQLPLLQFKSWRLGHCNRDGTLLRQTLWMGVGRGGAGRGHRLTNPWQQHATLDMIDREHGLYHTLVMIDREHGLYDTLVMIDREHGLYHTLAMIDREHGLCHTLVMIDREHGLCHTLVMIDREHSLCHTLAVIDREHGLYHTLAHGTKSLRLHFRTRVLSKDYRHTLSELASQA